VDVNAASYAILDVETTGLDPAAGHRVCEIGAIKLAQGNEAARFQTLVNPEREVDPGARAQHGIAQEDLLAAPTFSRIAADLRRFLAGCVLVAQNAEFDLSFLNSEFERCGMTRLAAAVIDTIALARRVRPGLRSYNLDSLAATFRVPVRNRHRSIGDCEVTVQVFLECLKALRQRGEVRTVADLVSRGAAR